MLGKLRKLSEQELKGRKYSCAALCPKQATHVLITEHHKYYYCDEHKPKEV